MINYIIYIINEQRLIISPVKVACVAAIAYIRLLTDQMSYINDQDLKFPETKICLNVK